jgi:toxin ParE1/3/4
MSQPYFSNSARIDLAEILHYISRDSPGRAESFVDAIEKECWLLASNPGLGTRREESQRNLRCWSYGNYIICFSPASDGIEVVRIVHGARDLAVLFR